MFFKQTRIFQKGLSKRHVFFKEVLSVRRTDLFISSNRYYIISSPRTPTIFQETLSRPRTHTIFQETPICLEHIDIFQEGTPS